MTSVQVDERVLRYILLKRDVYKRMPTTHKVAKLAARNIHLEQEQRLQAAREHGKALWWDPEVKPCSLARLIHLLPGCSSSAGGDVTIIENVLCSKCCISPWLEFF